MQPRESAATPRPRESADAAPTVADLVEEMERRWQELVTLRVSPDMYGSESLDGQLSELELWLLRLRQARPDHHG
ncbi:hypothetical protein [Salinifilum ghardaiensis]